MVLTSQPFGTYTNVEIIVADSQLEIIANLNSLKALIPDPTVTQGAVAGAKTDWDLTPPTVATMIRAEIDVLIAITDAAPVV